MTSPPSRTTPNELLVAFALLAILTALALAAPVRAPAPVKPSAYDGHWEADVKGDGRAFTFSFDFATKGDSLGGTVEGTFTDRVFPVTHGRVRNGAISFEAMGLWNGTLAGRDLKLVRELDGGKKQVMLAHRRPAPR